MVAVASRTGARAREVAERYGVPRWYQGYEALIADPAVEAVSVTTAVSLKNMPAYAHSFARVGSGRRRATAANSFHAPRRIAK